MSVKTLVYPVLGAQVNTGGLATSANQLVMISELQDINTELDGQTTLLTTMDASLTSIDAELVDVNTELNTQTTALGDINTELDTQTTALGDINTELDAQTVLLTSIESELQTISDALDVVDQLDSVLVDTSSTNIPGSASLPLQVVASLAANVKKVIVVEDIGEFYGIYTGAASSEVLKAVVPLGGGEIEMEVASGTRVSLRSLTATAISTGSIAIDFLG